MTPPLEPAKYSQTEPAPKALNPQGGTVPTPVATRPRAAQGTFRSLRHHNFQLYFGGQLISVAGTWMQAVAQAWLVYQISHSDLTLGIVGFAAAIPPLLVSPWGGGSLDPLPQTSFPIITPAGAF